VTPIAGQCSKRPPHGRTQCLGPRRRRSLSTTVTGAVTLKNSVSKACQDQPRIPGTGRNQYDPSRGSGAQSSPSSESEAQARSRRDGSRLGLSRPEAVELGLEGRGLATVLAGRYRIKTHHKVHKRTFSNYFFGHIQSHRSAAKAGVEGSERSELSAGMLVMINRRPLFKKIL
jgi:hypothetical protein